MGERKRIAVLGGGVGAMTTAFWLTQKPGWQDEYEITVYQMGWRLGGKGASGRNMSPGYGKRIEEHGLHIWLGFYDNAFRTMQQALGTLAELPDPPVATYKTWQEAFHPQALGVVTERIDDAWLSWPLLYPGNDLTPGSEQQKSDWELAVEMLKMTYSLFEDSLDDHGAGHGWALDHPGLLHRLGLGVVARALRGSTHAISRLVLRRLAGFASGLEKDASRHLEQHRRGLIRLASAFRALSWLFLRRRLSHYKALRLWVLLDLSMSTLIGMLRADVFKRGLDPLDDFDFREWLAASGAKPVTVNSQFLRAFYDLTFAFEQGDPNRLRAAAGSFIRAMQRMMFDFKGSVLYKMQSGMGDTIFTPLYGVLARRGVKFEFFHKVERICVDPADRARISEIRMQRQVELVPERRNSGYWPLVRVGKLDCWPSVPNYEQIQDGDKLREDPYDPGHAYDLESWWTSWQGTPRVLRRSDGDFDHVVLGISLGALPYIAQELIDASPKFRRMLFGDGTHPGLQTNRTMAAQLWLRCSAEQAGWSLPEWVATKVQPVPRPLVGAFADPFNTWCDMSQLLPTEDWSPSQGVQSVQYLTCPMPDDDQPPFDDHGYPRREREKVRELTAQWLVRNGAWLWREAVRDDPGSPLDPGLLASPAPGDGDPFGQQYFRANIDPSERYVLSVPGSQRFRLAPDDSGFVNLTLTGDWTKNAVNAGCVEAAVSSGMLASRAICGVPEKVAGVD